VVGLRGRSILCLRHRAIETRGRPESNCRLLVAQDARELLRVVGVEKHEARDIESRALF
jgi:hypothetical protein